MVSLIQQVSVLYDPESDFAPEGVPEFANLLSRSLARRLGSPKNKPPHFQSVPITNYTPSEKGEVQILLSPGDYSTLPKSAHQIRVWLAPDTTNHAGGMEHLFFNSDPHSGKASLFSPKGQDAHRFFLALQGLVSDLKGRLSSKPDPSEKNKERPKVFLAFNEELQQQRNRLKWELEHFGFEVVPDSSMSGNADDSLPELEKLLRESLASVHLIHQNYQNAEIGEGCRSPFVQNNIAARISTETGLLRLIWLPTGIDISSGSPHRELVRFRDNAQAIAGAEIYQEPIEGFKRTLLENLRDVRRQSSTPVREPEVSHLTSLYLVHPREANGSLEKVSDFFRSKNIEVWTTGQGSSLENRRNHHKYLQECDGVLILYPRENPIWLETKINDIRKATGMGRSEPIRLRGILHPSRNPLPSWDGLDQQFQVLTWNQQEESESLIEFSRELQKQENQGP